ncbi:hypothetical protein LTR27_006197 [Elasticomyces elasticus]|nr:hypothetical protein LTR27_006197 [Elasticomyces elasticus]
MAANDSTETPLLPTLPHELVEQITEYLDKSDLLSLRLVCNAEIVAATRRTFIKRHFWKRTHVYNFVGLQTLIDITADASLVKHIREIEVVPDPCNDYPPGDLFQFPGYAAQHMWSMFEAEQNWLKSHGAIMLRDVLKHLNEASHAVSFAVTRSEHSGHAYGSSAQGLTARLAQAKLVVVPDTLNVQRCGAIVDALLAASSREAAPIRVLDVGYHGPGYGLSKGGLGFTGEISSSSKTLWPALTCLKIHAGIGPRSWDKSKGGRKGLTGLNDLIAAAPNIQHFALNWAEAQDLQDGAWAQVRPMAEIGEIMARASLTTLELGPCSLFPEKVIIDFVSAHTYSLRHLKLSNVGLELKSSWHRVLKLWADNMRLSKVDLARIWRGDFTVDQQGKEYNPCYILSSESGSQRHVYEGEEMVKQGLLQLVSTATEKEDGGKC